MLNRNRSWNAPVRTGTGKTPSAERSHLILKSRGDAQPASPVVL
jgi:hypothetical protein